MGGKQSEYQNMKRYKKQKDVTAQNVLTVFVTTFLIMLVFFIGAAKHITPSVDVAIGEDSATDAKESGLGVKGFIDNRLKAIQSEDTSAIAKKLEEKANSTFDEEDDDNYFSKELEEKVKLPVKKVKQEVTLLRETEKEAETPIVKPTTVPQPKPSAATSSVQTTSLPTPTSVKVVVGSYSSIDQAKVAQKILQESNLGVTPFIKNVQGAYTLQVGSFSSEAKAQALANELLKNNFPARIIRN
ncbi:SPOR domain-containing protein [bacterium]|nr:SPOR domain-containing protein [bacterium]